MAPPSSGTSDQAREQARDEAREEARDEAREEARVIDLDRARSLRASPRADRLARPWGAPSRVGRCRTDVDCPPDRLCEDGRCV